jgi:hypothetical protein
MSGSSAYVLELSFGAGDSFLVCTEPEAVKRALEVFCANEGNQAAYRAVIVGGTLGVWVAQRNALTWFVDVAPFIRAELGHGARTLEELWRDERLLASWAEEMDEADPWLERVKLELFWDPIAERLPSLHEPVLQAGGELTLELPESLRLQAPRSLFTRRRHHVLRRS